MLFHYPDYQYDADAPHLDNFLYAEWKRHVAILTHTARCVASSVIDHSFNGLLNTDIRRYQVEDSRLAGEAA